MTISDIIAVILAASSVVTALSVLYVKLIKPIKSVVKQIEENQRQIKELHSENKTTKDELSEFRKLSDANDAILLKSTIAVLDGLEQAGANGKVSTTKRELINYLTEYKKAK